MPEKKSDSRRDNENEDDASPELAPENRQGRMRPASSGDCSIAERR